MTTDRVWGCCGKKWGESHARDCPRGSPYQHPFLLQSRAGSVHGCEGCNVLLDTATWPYALCLECRKKVSAGGDPLVQEIESIQREQRTAGEDMYLRAIDDMRREVLRFRVMCNNPQSREIDAAAIAYRVALTNIGASFDRLEDEYLKRT